MKKLYVELVSPLPFGKGLGEKDSTTLRDHEAERAARLPCAVGEVARSAGGVGAMRSDVGGSQAT